MVEAVKQHTAKDNYRDTTEVKNWSVAWSKTTTAVPDREKYWRVFERLLFEARDEQGPLKWKKGYKKWDYNYDGEYMSVYWKTGDDWFPKCPQ